MYSFLSLGAAINFAFVSFSFGQTHDIPIRRTTAELYQRNTEGEQRTRIMLKDSRVGDFIVVLPSTQ